MSGDTEFSEVACLRAIEGKHKWGPWSRPYTVIGRIEKWQERRCQCGNRDFRPDPNDTSRSETLDALHDEIVSGK